MDPVAFWPDPVGMDRPGMVACLRCGATVHAHQGSRAPQGVDLVELHREWHAELAR